MPCASAQALVGPGTAGRSITMLHKHICMGTEDGGAGGQGNIATSECEALLKATVRCRRRDLALATAS